MRLNSRLRKRIVQLARISVTKDYRTQVSSLIQMAQAKHLSPHLQDALAKLRPCMRLDCIWISCVGMQVDVLPLGIRPTKHKSDQQWYEAILRGMIRKIDANKSLAYDVDVATAKAVQSCATVEGLKKAFPELSDFADKAVQSMQKDLDVAIKVADIETGGVPLKALLKKGANARKPTPRTTAAT